MNKLVSTCLTKSNFRVITIPPIFSALNCLSTYNTLKPSMDIRASATCHFSHDAQMEITCEQVSESEEREIDPVIL